MAPSSITITFQRSIWQSSIHLRWYHPDKVKEVQQMEADDANLRDVFETVNMNLFIKSE